MSLKAEEMRTAGNSVATTAIKLYNEQRHRISSPRNEWVKGQCRNDKFGKKMRRDNPEFAWDFWRGVDDALAGEFQLHSGERVKNSHLP
jgi:hypothetical protein